MGKRSRVSVATRSRVPTATYQVERARRVPGGHTHPLRPQAPLHPRPHGAFPQVPPSVLPRSQQSGGQVQPGRVTPNPALPVPQGRHQLIRRSLPRKTQDLGSPSPQAQPTGSAGPAHPATPQPPHQAPSCPRAFAQLCPSFPSHPKEAESSRLRTQLQCHLLKAGPHQRDHQLSPPRQSL